MIVSEFLNDVAQRAGQTLDQELLNDETLRDHLFRQFNILHKSFNKRFRWPWRIKTTTIQSVPNYTTGSVTVVNGSRTVTGDSSVAWTSAMEGRILKLDRDTELYEIKQVTAANTIILTNPYIGTGASAQSYFIWKKYYDLDPDVPYASDIAISQWPYSSKELPRKDFDESLIRPWQNLGFDLWWTWAGINRKVSSYGGTFSVTLDSRTLTGTNTSFLDNAFNGSKIIVGQNDYNVETVDSDTQITMVQNALVTVSGAYTIETKNRSRIMLSGVPNPAINLIVTYYKKTYDYVSDNDEPEFWDGHETLLTNAMYAYLLEKLTSQKSFNWLSVFKEETRQAWAELNENKDSIDQVPRVSRGTISGYRPTLYG